LRGVRTAHERWPIESMQVIDIEKTDHHAGGKAADTETYLTEFLRRQLALSGPMGTLPSGTATPHARYCKNPR